MGYKDTSLGFFYHHSASFCCVAFEKFTSAKLFGGLVCVLSERALQVLLNYEIHY